MKTLKHLFTAMLLLCGIVANAHDFEVDGIYYKITDSTNKYVSVTYQGASASEIAGEYTGEVVIPESVTYNDVTYSVTAVAQSAFSGCSSITSITIPASVTSIGNQVFYECTALKEVIIEDGNTTLSLGYNSYSSSSYGGEGLFYDCPLETLYLGRNISYSSSSYYGYSPFYYKNKLTSVTINNNVTGLGENIFRNCSAITNLDIPSSVTSIGAGAFYGCSNITSITIPDGVTKIGENTFYGCSTITSMTIPGSVTSIGNYAFNGCRSLKYLTIEENSTTLSLGYNRSNSSSGGSGLFGDCPLETLNLGRNVSYTATQEYGYSPFYGKSKLTSLTIGHNVTSINSRMFESCTSLKELYIEDSETTLNFGYNGPSSSGYYSGMFSSAPLETLYMGRNISFSYIGDKYKCSPFYGKSKLQSLVISDKVTSIASYLFYGCTGLTNVEIPNSVTNIESYAFYGCSGIISTEIPNSVTNIGSYAFYGCTEITSINIPSSITNINEYTFYGCSKIIDITIPGSVTSIGSYAFYGCTGITSIIIPNCVTSIASSAFFGCSNLETVVNFSNLTFTKGATGYGYVAYYADNVINAPNGTIEGDFVFANINDRNTLVGYIKSSNLTESLSGLRLDPQLELEKFTFNANAGDSIIFDWSISSGAESDRLTVSIDGQSILTKAGKGNGTHKYVLTTDGTHTFTATYDAILNTWAYITNIKLIHTTVPTVDVVLPDSYKGKSYVIAENVFKDRWDITGLEIPSTVKAIGENAFKGCTNIVSITSYITADDLYAINSNVFEGVDKNNCTLYVPTGDDMIYALTDGWKEFYNIEEIETPSEITITIGQYGSATYCSTYALDFSNVKGLKAYTAAGYNKSTQVVTLLRVQSAERATGLFLKGAPGEYTVPVIDASDDYTLNMLVGTIRKTTVNSKSNDGEYFNFKYTVVGENNTPEFYQFEDGSTLGANKAYLQLPASLFPAAAKSIRARFDEGAFTDIEDVTTYNEEGVCYDLQGRAVKNPTNGFYIINGKKVLINNK